MDSKKKILFTFTLYATLNVILFFVIFAIFPFLGGNEKMHYIYEFILAESVNIICNSVLMFGYGNSLVKAKQMPYIFSVLFAILFNSIFIICIAALIQKPRKIRKNESEADRILH